MANLALIMTLLMLSIFQIPTQAMISSCDGPCRTLDDCQGQFICIKGKCNDDPDVGTPICGGACPPSGTFDCGGQSFPVYSCSPSVTLSTRAQVTNNDFDGGGLSACDGSYHKNAELIVALSTEWFDRWSRCGKFIRITASNGRRVRAKVVDECDSMHVCDEEHASQPPCRNNVVDGSDAVWAVLGLDKDLGIMDVTWSMDLIVYNNTSGLRRKNLNWAHVA